MTSASAHRTAAGLKLLDERFTRGQKLRALVYALVLLLVNALICWRLFVVQTVYMNSMHGFWVAIAKQAAGSWLHPVWWPYWDCGIPFEFTYAPLVPAVIALLSRFGMSPHFAFQVITGSVYCLIPFTFFLMLWLLTRAAGYSFAAALFYSLTAPTQLILPDIKFSLGGFWDARRLLGVGVWDETPHLTALALLPLVIVFLSLAIRRGGPFYFAAAVISISLASLASAFAPVDVAMATACLLFVLHREKFLRNLALTAGIGVFSWAICAPFYSPSLLRAVREAARYHGEAQWTLGSFGAVAAIAAGWAVLWRYLPRWTADWSVQFFVLFAYLTSSIPIVDVYFHLNILPQATRYQLEMELALAAAVVFTFRYLFERMPVPVRAALICLLLALAGAQILHHQEAARNWFHQDNFARTVEYKTSTWAEQNLPGVRVMLPGSIAQWANAFSPIKQFTGGSWSMAANLIQQRGRDAVYFAGGTPAASARISLAWLKAFGVGAVGISGPASEEYWKGFVHPARFEGVLPVLWSAGGVTLYRIPRLTESLAHVIPEAALVSRSPVAVDDISGMEQYVAALEDPALSMARLLWDGRNRIHIRTSASPEQVISVQISYHPGWKAKVNGFTRQLRPDALGMMWFRPECSGLCEVELEYDGGRELRACRFISFTAVGALLLLLLASTLRWWGLRGPQERGTLDQLEAQPYTNP